MQFKFVPVGNGIKKKELHIYIESKYLDIENPTPIGTWIAKYETDPSKVKKNPDVLYRTLNAYLDMLNKEDSIALYDLMMSTYEAIQEKPSVVEITDLLTTVNGRILDGYMNIEKIKQYLLDINIRYPETVTKEFDTKDSRKSKDKTYIQEEYRGLCAITMCAQLMFPLWAAFVNMLGGDIQKPQTNSMYLRTIMETNFIGSKDIDKLYNYIDVNLQAYEKMYGMSASIYGNGKDRIPVMIMGSILISKLPRCDVSSPVDNHVVVATNKAVKSEVDKIVNDNGRMIVRDNNRGNEEGEELGFLEGYTTRQRIGDEVYALNEHVLEDYRRVSSILDPEIPNKLIKDIINTLTKEFNNKVIQRHQLVISQWVLMRARSETSSRRLLNIRALPGVYRPSLINAIAITAAALITWKFEDIATLLLSSCKVNSTDGDDFANYSPTTISEISKETRTRLERTHSHKLPQQQRNSATKVTLSPAIITINKFMSNIEDVTWSLKVSEKVCDVLECDNGEYQTPSDIRNRLAELFLHLTAKKG